jgi:hypothetical protein
MLWHIPQVHLPLLYIHNFPEISILPPIYRYEQDEGTTPGKHQRKRCSLPAVNLVTIINLLFLSFFSSFSFSFFFFVFFFFFFFFFSSSFSSS